MLVLRGTLRGPFLLLLLAGLFSFPPRRRGGAGRRKEYDFSIPKSSYALTKAKKRTFKIGVLTIELSSLLSSLAFSHILRPSSTFFDELTGFPSFAQSSSASSCILRASSVAFWRATVEATAKTSRLSSLAEFEQHAKRYRPTVEPPAVQAAPCAKPLACPVRSALNRDTCPRFPWASCCRPADTPPREGIPMFSSPASLGGICQPSLRHSGMSS
ncbi:hypothetical protein PG991_000771 [Apiospora marii]|uniref:Secreted protein n=1 Tax=Apiospora marii TaxID=335849 RepID=A0ABR1SSY4_9PEZI